jgi:DNA processing protein
VSTQVAEQLWQEACAVALTTLPGMGPARLSALLADLPPDVAWAGLGERLAMPKPFLVACGPTVNTLLQDWAKAVRRTDPVQLLEEHHRLDVGVWTSGGEYPEVLQSDICPPAVLFWQGDASALDGHPRVAIIGTRRCTPSGRRIARDLAAELTEAGVSVVSGLALGIDGAAHRGALEALDSGGVAPIAVVGGGLDVVYPRQHADLWADMSRRGLMLSEAPLGMRPEQWRFPARNRIIAALSDVVVVVESHESGGSMLTVEEADMRGITVAAVPGSIENPAARGTNGLLVAGFPMISCAADVLMYLEQMSPAEIVPVQGVLPTGQLPDDPRLAVVLDAIDWEPTSLEDVLARTGMEPSDVVIALMELEENAWIEGEAGWWQRASRGA